MTRFIQCQPICIVLNSVPANNGKELAYSVVIGESHNRGWQNQDKAGAISIPSKESHFYDEDFHLGSSATCI